MRVRPAAVTVWDGHAPFAFAPAELDAGTAQHERLLRRATGSPVWIDMDLVADPTLWLQPWDTTDVDNVDWSEMEGLARLLGFALPSGDVRAADAATTALNRLPVLNELAVLRWLTEELETSPDASAVPLVGFIPVSTLTPRRPAARHPLAERLAFVLLRVNAAVVGDFVFTIRLPDRICVGAGIGRHVGRRIPADAGDFEPPDLTVFGRYLPPGRPPQAHNVATALAIYLSATCGAAAEHARERLCEIERGLAALAPAAELGESEDGQAAPLHALCQDVFRTRGALQSAEEELMRVVQRQAEAGARADDPLGTTRERYEHGLDEIRAVQRDLRAIGDAVTARIASSQIHIAQQVEQHNSERQERLQGLVGILGTALVVPALVATLFSDSVRLPYPRPVTGLVAMLGVMVLSALVVAWYLGLMKRRTTWAGRSTRAPLAG